ncbi:MAG: hypothetical protein EHM13_04830 [Acidobacteria bacterium]|nr:MAG: hypothetical protein EHM13_04830 [Acidobacteriota bacterium]
MERGDLVPQFEVTTLEGNRVSYSTIWQHRNLVLVRLPTGEREDSRQYASSMVARAQGFAEGAATCVITRDEIPWAPAPGVVVADRWGEIVHLAAAPNVAGLPSPSEILEWVHYIETRCPECEGEAK